MPAPVSAVQVLGEACRELVELLDASAAIASRVLGDLLLELVTYSRTERSVQASHEFLISDFPLTEEVVAQLEPRRVSRLDEDADVRETELLAQLGFDSLLMLPLAVRGRAWALLEIYLEGGRRFDAEDERRAKPVVEAAERALERLTSR